VRAPLAQVEAALAVLVQRQRLCRVRLPDGSTLYRGPCAYRDDACPQMALALAPWPSPSRSGSLPF
jgi:hypothetical protein